MAIVCDAYPQVQVSKENFVNIQRAIDGLVDGLPEEGFTHKFIDTYRAKGATKMVCRGKETLNWLDSNVSSLEAWDFSRLKMFGLEALPAYKRGVAWFPGHARDKERYFQRFRRLNQGLNSSQWRVYERK